MAGLAVLAVLLVLLEQATKRVGPEQQAVPSRLTGETLLHLQDTLPVVAVVVVVERLEFLRIRAVMEQHREPIHDRRR